MLAPSGWHVPTKSDWEELKNYLISNGYNWDDTLTGNKIGKSMASRCNWPKDSTEGCVGFEKSTNNESGFSALPGGYRYYDGSWGGHPGIIAWEENYGSVWWSSTVYDDKNAYEVYLSSIMPSLQIGDFPKIGGAYVRLLRD